MMNWDSVTLGEALRKTARSYPERLALVSENSRMTFAEFDRRVDEVALGLGTLGTTRGDSVALLMINCPEWVVTWIACARLGATVVPINTRNKLEEMEYILRQSDAKVLITVDRYWSIDFLAIATELKRRLPGLRSVVCWDSVEAPGTVSLDQLASRGSRLLDEGATLPAENPKDPVIIVYTSGTTGRPKGAMHNHIVLHNTANIARAMHIVPGDVILGHMPFYHVAGLFTEVTPMILLGCTLVTLPHWEPDRAIEIIERENVNIFGGIPTHFIDCIDALARKPRKVSMKSAWIGGAPVTPDVALAAKKALGLQGLLCVYGMTETSSSTTMSEFDAPLEVLCANKGKPIGDFEVVVVDPAAGTVLPAGQVGEVRVRGHIVMMGYYNDPEATREVIGPEGWFRTGDLGVFDESGYLQITGRLKEMFIVGGSNAYPAEIERVLQSHPSVKQAIVVGVSDRRLGEVGFAFVQAHEGAQVAIDELSSFCKTKLADYKVPRHFRIVDDFPRTSTGKIQRFILWEMARENAAPATAK